MTRLVPWIGRAAHDASRADVKPLISHIDDTKVAGTVECVGDTIDVAMCNADTASLAHRDCSVKQRTTKLHAAAVDEIESPVISVLISSLGKPCLSAAFKAERAAAFIRACAAQLPYFQGEMLPLDATPLRQDRFGGVGSSGFGRQALRYAMGEKLQRKLGGVRLNPK